MSKTFSWSVLVLVYEYSSSPIKNIVVLECMHLRQNNKIILGLLIKDNVSPY